MGEGSGKVGGGQWAGITSIFFGNVHAMLCMPAAFYIGEHRLMSCLIWICIIRTEIHGPHQSQLCRVACIAVCISSLSLHHCPYDIINKLYLYNKHQNNQLQEPYYGYTPCRWNWWIYGSSTWRKHHKSGGIDRFHHSKPCFKAAKTTENDKGICD